MTLFKKDCKKLQGLAILDFSMKGGKASMNGSAYPNQNFNLVTRSWNLRIWSIIVGSNGKGILPSLDSDFSNYVVRNTINLGIFVRHQKMSITACLSHKEDVDGILSAVLIKAAFNAKIIILVDYPNIISSLHRLASADFLPKFDRIFVSDLGLSKKNEGEFIAIIGKIISNDSKVIYIDHHDLNPDTIFALKKIGVLLIHSVEECSSVQIYDRFKKKLKPHAAFFAAASSLTDYMENKPIASAIVSRYDRQFLMLESTVLSYIISAKQHDDEFLIQIVNFLSGMRYPHDIEGGFSIAERYAKNVSDAIKTIEGSITKSDNIAYAQNNSALSASMIVNFVLGISERPVAMVYKLKEEINSYIFSIRGNESCKVHLGRIVNQVSSEIGGSGGGHEKACGAVVPREKLKQFIYLLDQLVA